MRMRRLCTLSLVIAWMAGLGLGASPAYAGEEIFWTFSSGVDYSAGNYGFDEETKLLYVPTGITMDYGRWRFRMLLPLLYNDGPSSVDVAGRSTDSERSVGLGQIETSGSYLFPPIAQAFPYVELTGRVQAPTETESDLGSGTWSFDVQIDLFKEWGRVTPFASFGRQFYTGNQITDRFHTSVGAGVRIHDRVSAGLAYDFFESTSGGQRYNAHSLVPFASVRIGERWTLGPYGVIGFSDGAPDYGVGIRLSVRP